MKKNTKVCSIFALILLILSLIVNSLAISPLLFEKFKYGFGGHSHLELAVLYLVIANALTVLPILASFILVIVSLVRVEGKKIIITNACLILLNLVLIGLTFYWSFF